MPRSCVLLSHLFRRLRFKQYLVARQLKIHRSTVGRWRRGLVLPPIECIHALATLLIQFGCTQKEASTWVVLAVDDLAGAPVSSWITTPDVEEARAMKLLKLDVPTGGTFSADDLTAVRHVRYHPIERAEDFFRRDSDEWAPPACVNRADIAMPDTRDSLWCAALAVSARRLVMRVCSTAEASSQSSLTSLIASILRAGVARHDLARHLGVHRTSVSRYLSGSRRGIPSRHVLRFARALIALRPPLVSPADWTSHVIAWALKRIHDDIHIAIARFGLTGARIEIPLSVVELLRASLEPPSRRRAAR